MRKESVVDEWLSSDPRIKKFSLEGSVDEGFLDEWELYDLIRNHMSNMPNYIADTAIIASSAEIVGNVIIDEGAEILPFTNIKGPAYIGKNVIVGNFSFIRPYTFLSLETLVGNHSYCNEVVTAPKCRASHYVGCSRSIFMRNSTLSSFVLTATLRADYKPIINSPELIIKKRGCIIGENTYLAPHVTVSPGVRIGRGCFIGSYITITKDVDINKFLKANIEVLEKENSIQVGERSFSTVIEI